MGGRGDRSLALLAEGGQLLVLRRLALGHLGLGLADQPVALGLGGAE